MIKVIQSAQKFLITAYRKNEAAIVTHVIFSRIMRHPDCLTSQGRMCRSARMKDSTNRRGTGYIVGKNEKTVSSWDDAEAITFAETSRSKRLAHMI
jgi:hypothetical protein